MAHLAILWLFPALVHLVSSASDGANVTRTEVEAAQMAWGDALVHVAVFYDTLGFDSAKALAERLIDEQYGYQLGPVLFKPTLASGNATFRTTREGALSYFIGHNASYPTDTGFAFKHWRKVEVQNAAILLNGDSGTSVGNVIFIDRTGKATVVDKTWTFVKDSQGKLRIVAHHSSLPYLPSSPAKVTEDEVRAAQKAWGDALVDISKTYDEQGFEAAKTLAERVIDDAYGYQYGPVLFKPTLANGNDTFRTTREGAVAYFVGHDPNFPSDHGFALKHWRKVEIQNAAIFRDGSTGTSVGNVIITDRDGKVTVVDKTWTFFKAADGKLRIVAHHSSLPYQPRGGSVSRAEVAVAQKAWGDALVNVSRTYDERGFEAAKALSERLIDELYGYQMGPVLFKPTLAYGNTTFRTTREGALSYFIGHNANYPTDTGFALKHWRKIEAQNAAIFVDSDSGTSVGNVLFTDVDGKVTVVDKTWTFVKDSEGKMRITAHHSSLPYLSSSSPPKVTEDEVQMAQKAWGDGLVRISVTYEEQGFAAAESVAEQVIDDAYGYQLGPVLFKPTLASGNRTFRTTREGAVAYFVGRDPNFPEDLGFALKGWRKVEFQNAAIFRDGSSGTSVGNVFLTDRDGKVTVVDKTLTFFKAADGKLRIVAHHSSLPYKEVEVKVEVTASPPEVDSFDDSASRATLAVSTLLLVLFILAGIVAGVAGYLYVRKMRLDITIRQCEIAQWEKQQAATSSQLRAVAGLPCMPDQEYALQYPQCPQQLQHPQYLPQDGRWGGQAGQLQLPAQCMQLGFGHKAPYQQQEVSPASMSTAYPSPSSGAFGATPHVGAAATPRGPMGSRGQSADSFGSDEEFQDVDLEAPSGV